MLDIHTLMLNGSCVLGIQGEECMKLSVPKGDKLSEIKFCILIFHSFTFQFISNELIQLVPKFLTIPLILTVSFIKTKLYLLIF